MLSADDVLGAAADAAAADELLEASTVFKSLPVSMLVEALLLEDEVLREPLGGKLGGMGVESTEEFLLEWLSGLPPRSSSLRPGMMDFGLGSKAPNEF